MSSVMNGASSAAAVAAAHVMAMEPGDEIAVQRGWDGFLVVTTSGKRARVAALVDQAIRVREEARA